MGRIILGAALILAGVAAAASASAEPWLRIDGVTGDSPSRPGWIDIQDFNGGTTGAGADAALFPGRPAQIDKYDFILADGAVARRLSRCGSAGCHFAGAAEDDDLGSVVFKQVIVRATGKSGDAFTFTILSADSDMRIK